MSDSDDDVSDVGAPPWPKAHRAMSSPCSICRHPEAGRIERSIEDGRSIRQLAQEFSVSRDALGRHLRNGHVRVPSSPAAAGEPRVSPAADPLHELAQALRARAMAGDAAAAREYRLSLQAIEVSANATVSDIDYTSTAEYQAIRSALMQSLEPFPKARQAVAAALVELDA